MGRPLEIAVEPPAAAIRRGTFLVAVFTLTLFTSSTLLFLVQPMFAKMVLPLLGGTPAVWNTAMLFFQAALLAGYLYAHASIAWLGVRRQAWVHVVIVALPLLLLPISVPGDWAPPNEGQTLWLLLLLSVSLGAPFFVVSSTAPLLQSWFAAIGHRSSGDPYFLYAASNLGSMLSLLAYPLVLESRLALDEQTDLWTLGYGAFLAFVVACAVAVWRKAPTRGAVSSPAGAPVTEPDAVAELTVGRRVRWVALAFVPSSLMLGVTTYLTTDIASVPLLWIIPLSIYLLSFILVFSPTLARSRTPLVRVLPLLLLALTVVVVLKATGPTWLMIPLHLGAFLAVAVVLHGELARDRPAPRHLTQFYLWIAIGGVLGGLFNALIAPVLFDSVAEYPIVIALAAMLMPSYASGKSGGDRNRLDILLPLSVGVLAVLLAVVVSMVGLETTDLAGRMITIGVPVLVILSFDTRPIRFGLGIAALLLATALPVGTDEQLVYSDRSFFSVHRVVDDGEFHELVHGNTIHGSQSLDPAQRTTPLTYYHPSGPLGALFSDAVAETDDPNVGIVGLGTGAMACYARPGETWTFYEIDPQVEKIARDPSLFTFLRDCTPEADVVLGDARLQLASASEDGYDLLVLDAFSSDSIPVHLVTREAVELYRSKLAADGILVFHISNRYLHLEPVISQLAADAGMTAYIGEDLETGGVPGKTASIWVAMSEDRGRLEGLSEARLWRPLPAHPDAPLWRDDFSNVLSVFTWR